MDTEQLSNYRKHPSHILDIRKTHSVWRNPGEWNCNSCRLQRRELIKSISLWPFYSQKGDWHPSGMAPVCRVPVPWRFGLSPGSFVCSPTWYTNPTFPTIQKMQKRYGKKCKCPIYHSFLSGSPVVSEARSVWARSALGQEPKQPEKCFLHVFSFFFFFPPPEDRGAVLTNETLCFCLTR